MGETFLSTIQKAAEVASALCPGSESPSTQGPLLQGDTYQPAVTPSASHCHPTPGNPLPGAIQGSRGTRETPLLVSSFPLPWLLPSYQQEPRFLLQAAGAEEESSEPHLDTPVTQLAMREPRRASHRCHVCSQWSLVASPRPVLPLCPALSHCSDSLPAALSEMVLGRGSSLRVPAPKCTARM